MRIVQFNYGLHGSTGGIVKVLSQAASLRNDDVTVFTYKAAKNREYGFEYIVFDRKTEYWASRLCSVVSGYYGHDCYFGTRKAIALLKDLKPDIIHLHNMHGWYIDIDALFSYIRTTKTKCIWTLHDCWAFTGQCSHYMIEGCNKWISGCHNCERIHFYPNSLIDRTKEMWNRKRAWFTGIEQLKIVTPSKWLASQVSRSFLSQYETAVINNGVNTDVFYPHVANPYEKYGCASKRIILGVASEWSARKGLDVFIRLSECLPRDYRIVLIGTNSKIDKLLPKTIVSIHRTNNQQELAELYSAACLFFNPTKEENFPTVNIEAIACGTPVLTFNSGGCGEMLDTHCGTVIEATNSVERIRNAVIEAAEKKWDKTRIYSHGSQYSISAMTNKYLELYDSV